MIMMKDLSSLLHRNTSPNNLIRATPKQNWVILEICLDIMKELFLLVRG